MAAAKWHNPPKVEEMDDRCHMRRILLFTATCSAFLGMAHGFGESEERLGWSCKNYLGSDDREVLWLYAGEDPTASLGEVRFDSQRVEAAYVVQGLEHHWIWPIAKDAEELSEAIDAIRFLLRLRPGGITHYFDYSMPEDEDGNVTATMTFMCERNEISANSEQLNPSQNAIPQESKEYSANVITLQCQELMMPNCILTHMQATQECEGKGYNGAVLKSVRQPGNLHDFECVK